MMNLIKPPVIPDRLTWEYAREPEMISWTIRARSYNTFVANLVFWFFCVVAFCFSYFVHSGLFKDEPIFGAIATVFSFVAILLVTASMTHQRINFAYRLSASGIEYCKWKDFPRWMLVGLNWFMGIAALVVICLAGDNPSALLAGILGPGAIGLMSWMMLNSKNYQEMQSEYHHGVFEWEDITHIILGTNRVMIELLSRSTKGEELRPKRGRLYIFFTKKNKEVISSLIKSRLSAGAEYTVGKIEVF